MTMFHLLKIRTSIDIFNNEKCKVTFGLEYSYDIGFLHIIPMCFCRNFLYHVISTSNEGKVPNES